LLVEDLKPRVIDELIVTRRGNANDARVPGTVGAASSGSCQADVDQ
jgi:hypothetical protein